MTALAVFLQKEKRPLCDLLTPLTYAEISSLEEGRHNIRDRDFVTIIGVGFLLDSSQTLFLNNANICRISEWVIIKGIITSNQSIVNWFNAIGLQSIESRAGLAVITSGNGQSEEAAPIAKSGDFIGGAVGYVSDYLRSAFQKRDKILRDGAAFLRNLTLKTILQVPYSMHLALVSLDGLTLRLIRSIEHTQRKGAKPYIYYAETEYMIVFGSFEENPNQLGATCLSRTLEESSYVDAKLGK